MKFGTKNVWAGISLAALAATGLDSCATMEPLKTTGCVGGVLIPEIKWNISVGPNGDRTGDVNASPRYANKCAEITWIDEKGKAISSDLFQLDGDGDGSISVPTGSTSMQLVVGKCPEGQSGNTGGGSLENEIHGPLPLLQEPHQSPVTIPDRAFSDYMVLRRPIEVPDLSPRATQLIHSMRISARTFEGASAKAANVVANGIGQTVPPGVIVFEYIEITQKLSEIEFRAALPDKFSQFYFEVNDMAHVANLSTDENVKYATQGSWTTCTTEIPVTAFHTTPNSGSEILNRCELRFAGTSANHQATFHVMESSGH